MAAEDKSVGAARAGTASTAPRAASGSTAPRPAAGSTGSRDSVSPRRDSLSDVVEGPPRLGKYKVIAQLGEGGGATVYLAVASGPAGVNKLLVVKVLKKQLANEPDFVRMFIDEARLSARLNHPNIVQMIEVVSGDERYFTVMEYLDGKPLSHLLGARIPGVGLNVLVHLIAEALGGLHYAHELVDYDGTPLGVIHRDVSPQNIFVTYDGRAKLLDFGVAKMVFSNETELGVVKGKPRYMAPEQAVGGTLDRRADIFSAGVILWEAVVGRRMWAGMHDMAVLYAVSNGHIPSLAEFAPDAPTELRRIVTKALSQDPDERHPTALALQEELEAYLRGTGEIVTPRAIGRSLTQHFTSDRAHIKAAIDSQLGAMGGSAREFRVVSLQSEGSPEEASYEVVVDERERGERKERERKEQERKARAQVQAQDEEEAPAQSSVVPSPVPPKPKAGRSGIFVAIVLATAVGVGFLGWRRGLLTGSSIAAPPAAPATATTLPPTPTLGAPLPSSAPTSQPASRSPGDTASVALAAKASPPQAQLFLDGEPLDSNPYTGRRPKDSAPHVLRAEASGYSSSEMPVDLSKDGLFELTLVRKSSHGGGGEAPVTATGTGPRRSNDVSPDSAGASPGAPPAPSTTTSPRAPKKRAVDRNDPYAE